MLIKEGKQFIRELVDITNKEEVEIYNQHQKELTDNLIFAIGQDNEAPDFFLEVLTPNENRREELIKQIRRLSNGRASRKD